MKRILVFTIAGVGALIATALHCGYTSDRVARYTGDTVALLVVPGVFALAATIIVVFVLSPPPEVWKSCIGVSIVFTLAYAPILALWLISA